MRNIVSDLIERILIWIESEPCADLRGDRHRTSDWITMFGGMV